MFVALGGVIGRGGGLVLIMLLPSRDTVGTLATAGLLLSVVFQQRKQPVTQTCFSLLLGRSRRAFSFSLFQVRRSFWFCFNYWCKCIGFWCCISLVPFGRSFNSIMRYMLRVKRRQNVLELFFFTFFLFIIGIVVGDACSGHV